jgi:ADP-heptose:LPS heptosyltransferase
VALPVEPYSYQSGQSSDAVAAFADRLSAFRPDALVFASHLWTTFEESLPSLLSGVPVFAMNGYPFVESGERPQSGVLFADQVAVDVWSHELEKNRLLAQSLLKRQLPLTAPALSATPEQLQAAMAVLAALGLEPGQYWIACTGEGPRTVDRNWPIDKWAQALDHGIAAYGMRFLLVGDESEQQSIDHLQSLLGREEAISLPYFRDNSDVLIGVTALASGYIGRDTGPMHLAAALDKPVIAVCWAAHWPRFVPAAQTARVIALDVPCRGCESFCQFPVTYCVKNIPVSAVLSAIDDLAGGGTGQRVRVLSPDEYEAFPAIAT